MPTTESANHADDRKSAGARIDPATAEVWFEYGQVLDPYGELKLLPEEICVGRQWFAADPVERIAVHFFDLPAVTREALEGRRQAVDREGWALLLSGWCDHREGGDDAAA